MVQLFKPPNMLKSIMLKAINVINTYNLFFFPSKENAKQALLLKPAPQLNNSFGIQHLYTSAGIFSPALYLFRPISCP
jgi:hypothetical protein